MIIFEVPGLPAAQGSKKHVGGGVMVEMNKNLKPWRAEVIAAARAAFDGQQMILPLRVTALFQYARPKSHYGTGGNAARLKATAPTWKQSAPDLDKLQRALGDALTQAGVIRDDALIAEWLTSKAYGDRSCTYVTVQELTRAQWVPNDERQSA